MKRILVVTACGFGLSACAGGPDWMPSLPQATPPTITLALESQPPGAEAQASTGQSCQTPCSLSLPPADVTVTFTREGFQPQSVDVQVVRPSLAADPGLGGAQAPRFNPATVLVELEPAPPPPRRRAAPPPRQTTKPASAPAPTPAAAPPPPPPPPPAPAPSSPWPPVPAQQ